MANRFRTASKYSIEAINVSKTYSNGVTALNNITFVCNHNEKVLVLGPNGSGKSTLLKILAGIVKPTKGYVKVLGFVPYKREKEFLKSIGVFLSSKPFLIPDIPVIESLRLVSVIYGISWKESLKRIEKLMRILNLDQDLLRRSPRTMSLGQRMKFEIIASLLHEPMVVLLDEPFIGLDPDSRKALAEYLHGLDATVVVASHIINDVWEEFTRVIVLDHGRVVYDGDAKALSLDRTSISNA